MTTDRAIDHITHYARAEARAAISGTAEERVRALRYGDHLDGAEAVEVIGEAAAIGIYERARAEAVDL